jgi:hypothetical protein
MLYHALQGPWFWKIKYNVSCIDICDEYFFKFIKTKKAYIIYMRKRSSSGLWSQKGTAELQGIWFLWVFFVYCIFRSGHIISLFSWPITIFVVNYSITLLKFGFKSGKYRTSVIEIALLIILKSTSDVNLLSKLSIIFKEWRVIALFVL